MATPPAGGDTNLYAYVGGDPINAIDPSGLYIETAFDVLAVAGWCIYRPLTAAFGTCSSDGLAGNCAISVLSCYPSSPTASCAPYAAYVMSPVLPVPPVDAGALFAVEGVSPLELP